MKKYISAAAIFAIIVVGVYWIQRDPETQYSDLFCSYIAETYHMGCPVQVAGVGVFSPGSIVASPKIGGEFSRYELPHSNLFESECLIAGATILKLEQISYTAGQAVTFARQTYEASRTVDIGASLTVPELAGLQLNAGPKWSEVKSISIAADRAWNARLDEYKLLSNIESCYISEKCVSKLVALNDRIINNILAVEGFKYIVSLEDGRELSLKAAIEGEFLNVGGELSSKIRAGQDVLATEATIIGVSPIRDEAIRQAKICGSQTRVSGEGRIELRVEGQGIGQEKVEISSTTRRAPMELSYTGNESISGDKIQRIWNGTRSVFPDVVGPQPELALSTSLVAVKADVTSDESDEKAAPENADSSATLSFQNQSIVKAGTSPRITCSKPGTLVPSCRVDVRPTRSSLAATYVGSYEILKRTQGEEVISIDSDLKGVNLRVVLQRPDGSSVSLGERENDREALTIGQPGLYVLTFESEPQSLVALTQGEELRIDQSGEISVSTSTKEK